MLPAGLFLVGSEDRSGGRWREGGREGGEKEKGPASIKTGAPIQKKIRQRPTLPHGNRAVPLALEGLTTVFGMGTGVTPPMSPPENVRPENRPMSGQGE